MAAFIYDLLIFLLTIHKTYCQRSQSSGRSGLISVIKRDGVCQSQPHRDTELNSHCGLIRRRVFRVRASLRLTYLSHLKNRLQSHGMCPGNQHSDLHCELHEVFREVYNLTKI